MFVQRSAAAAVRSSVLKPVVRRAFTTSFVRRDAGHGHGHHELVKPGDYKGAFQVARQTPLRKLEEIKTEEDLLPPGATPGTIPTDIDQATGLERLEILGKTQGIDVFDMKPLDSSRVGTPEDPIVVNSFGDEQYVGCTGCPADSHIVQWITLSRAEPMERCMECGSTYKMHYVGPADDAHGHDHHHAENPYPKPKNMADFIKAEYKWA